MVYPTLRLPALLPYSAGSVPTGTCGICTPSAPRAQLWSLSTVPRVLPVPCPRHVSSTLCQVLCPLPRIRPHSPCCRVVGPGPAANTAQPRTPWGRYPLLPRDGWEWEIRTTPTPPLISRLQFIDCVHMDGGDQAPCRSPRHPETSLLRDLVPENDSKGTVKKRERKITTESWN